LSGKHLCDWTQEEIIGTCVSTTHVGIPSHEAVPKNFEKLMTVSLGCGVVGYGPELQVHHQHDWKNAGLKPKRLANKPSK